jgi:hypothetical protein
MTFGIGGGLVLFLLDIVYRICYTMCTDLDTHTNDKES